MPHLFPHVGICAAEQGHKGGEGLGLLHHRPRVFGGSDVGQGAERLW